MILQLNQSQPFSGLVTATFTAPADGTYKIQVYATVPTGSNLEIEVDDDDDETYTIGGEGDALGPALGGTVTMTVEEGDEITVTLTSDAAVDAVRNAVKGTINVFQTEQL